MNALGRILRQGFSWPQHREWRSLFLHLFGDDSPVALGEQKQEMQRLMLVGFLYEHGMIDDPDLTIPLRRGGRVAMTADREQGGAAEQVAAPRSRRPSRTSRSRPASAEATPAPATPDPSEATPSETFCLTPTEAAEPVSDVDQDTEQESAENVTPSVSQKDIDGGEVSHSDDDNDRKDEREPLVSTEPSGDPVNTEERSDDRAENVAPKERKVGFLKGFNG